MSLEDLYRQIADLTLPICATCTPPYHCEEPAGCHKAKFWAKHVYGVELENYNDTDLPFLAETGCTVAPWHRMMCSMWLCPEGMTKAPQEFYELKKQIMALESARFKKNA